jgi:hypothetical protein
MSAMPLQPWSARRSQTGILPAMKETLTLELGRLQARILKIALGIVGQFAELPPGEPVYSLPRQGVEYEMVKAEILLTTRKTSGPAP